MATRNNRKKSAADEAADTGAAKRSAGRNHDMELYKLFAAWLGEEHDIKITANQVLAVRSNFNQHFRNTDVFKEHQAAKKAERDGEKARRSEDAKERKAKAAAKKAERADAKATKPVGARRRTKGADAGADSAASKSVAAKKASSKKSAGKGKKAVAKDPF